MSTEELPTIVPNPKMTFGGNVSKRSFMKKWSLISDQETKSDLEPI